MAGCPEETQNRGSCYSPVKALRPSKGEGGRPWVWPCEHLPKRQHQPHCCLRILLRLLLTLRRPHYAYSLDPSQPVRPLLRSVVYPQRLHADGRRCSPQGRIHTPRPHRNSLRTRHTFHICRNPIRNRHTFHIRHNPSHIDYTRTPSTCRSERRDRRRDHKRNPHNLKVRSADESHPVSRS